MRYWLTFVLSLLASVYGMAAPVLITVELPTVESKKSWHQLKIPTYELIGNTAIAETEESRVGWLRQRGFQPNVIDRQPDLTRFMIVSNYDQVLGLKAIPVWRNAKTVLIKPDSNGKETKKDYKHQARPLNTRPLPDRFWQSIVETRVARRNITADPFVQSVVDQVNSDSIGAVIQRLQAFQTRFVMTDSSAAASAWLKQKLDSLGFAAFYDSFSMDGSWAGNGMERNVIAQQPGAVLPGTELILCGHFDSYSEISPLLSAPGADDNASGIAATIEAARIFRQYSWKHTITYACWSGEEEWMWGSGHYAFKADSQDAKIGAVMNMDMIGYMNDGSYDVCVGYTDSYDYCQWLVDLYLEAAAVYVSGLTVYEQADFISDNTYFSQVGYPAIGTEEYPNAWAGGNPNYHQPTDVYSSLDPVLFTMVARASLATIAVIGISPGSVDGVAAHDVGVGDRLRITWSPSYETDITGYQVCYGRVSGQYTDTMGVAGDSFDIAGLMTDTTYYVTVWAIDTAGRVSPNAVEVTGAPRLLPRAPEYLTAVPVDSGITVAWNANLELDLAGYDVYRKIDGSSYDSLTSLGDTFILDKPLSGAGRYYYKVKARDTDGNYSPFSDTVYCRPITLDQGILLVDETNNWTTGSFPRDAQQDSFYNYILNGYKYEPYEYGSSLQKPVLADFGPYSTVAWLADDYAGLLASGAVNDMRSYLDNGGKLWLAGWKPSGNLHNTVTYPADYTAGDIMYEYFKVDRAELSGSTDSFKTAIGLGGYPSIMVDTLKYPASTLWGKTMRYIEALTPLAGADTIYVMDMRNNGSPYEGRACAVRDSGKTVFFGFPLYFMDREQVKAAVQKVMAEFGEEPLGVTGKPENLEMITSVRLFQNSPNPFSSQTNISYQLPKAGMVSLNIYNIAGQLVKTLVNGNQAAGNYVIKWDRLDSKNSQVSAGVYIY
ncbi:MAG: M20/M25/M40 family metallo-hydrolase, partial [bacterium]|nr:M20/M25/M40 family metallo-hydrolase [bacterium]